MSCPLSPSPCDTAGVKMILYCTKGKDVHVKCHLTSSYWRRLCWMDNQIGPPNAQWHTQSQCAAGTWLMLSFHIATLCFFYWPLSLFLLIFPIPSFAHNIDVHKFHNISHSHWFEYRRWSYSGRASAPCIYFVCILFMTFWGWSLAQLNAHKKSIRSFHKEGLVLQNV